MSTGKETESRAVDLYEAAGYETYRPPKAKYREQDVFGLFDLLAFGHGRLELVQCKTNRARGITEWSRKARVYEANLTDVRVRFAVLFEGEGWKLYYPTADGYQVAYDGRECQDTPTAALREVLQA
jgi:hypothetical protein